MEKKVIRVGRKGANVAVSYARAQGRAKRRTVAAKPREKKKP